MANNGTCPHCKNLVSEVTLEKVTIKLAKGLQSPSGSKALHGVSYLCRHCSAVLSIDVDPLAMQSDLADEVRSAIRDLE